VGFIKIAAGMIAKITVSPTDPGYKSLRERIERLIKLAILSDEGRKYAKEHRGEESAKRLEEVL